MRFIQYQVKWKNGQDKKNVVEFWLKRGVNVHEMMWPFLNLAELDADDHGYITEVTDINEIDVRVIE